MLSASLTSPAVVPPFPRRVTVLGSTGSIGTQALQLIRSQPDTYTVAALAAGGSNVDALAQQALEFRPPVIAVAANRRTELMQAFDVYSGEPYRPEILTGPTAITEVAGRPADVVLNGITGSIGLLPTLAALRSGALLALANKESLIVGGEAVTAVATPGQIVPVDSEHSAIAQCLASGRHEQVRRLVVTASGGPFRGRTREQLCSVTVEQAMAHPNYAMGNVITVNSATLMNKGLELIEAHLLFELPMYRIDTVVHPEQMIHSMVEFTDGSTLAQASPPSMLIPIALGLSWPERWENAGPACNWEQASTWSFEPVDHRTFPALTIAREVGAAGGVLPAVMNAANEECVAAFASGTIEFLDIVDTVQRVVNDVPSTVENHPLSEAMLALVGNHPDAARVHPVLAAEHWARTHARTLMRS